MRSSLILNEIRKTINVVYPRAVVIMPNEPLSEDSNDAELFFEVAISGQDYSLETETSTSSSAIASVVIVGKRNTGCSKLDEIAETFIATFSPIGKSGVNFNRSLFVDDSENISYLYIKNVERSEAGIYDGKYKLTIFISLEIYEDRKYARY